MLVYDFEVFAHDWLTVVIDTTTQQEHVIINDSERLRKLYEDHSGDIWVGFNNKHYDQYIFKGILLGMDPKDINDFIIVQGQEGWAYSSAFRKIKMINYDVMPNPPVGLKTMEAFMGSNIKETDVDFRLDRKLTEEEIQQTVKYCRHDVEETIKVFMAKIDDFNAIFGIVKAFPDQVNIWNIGDSEARITARVLGCERTSFEDEFDYEFLPCIELEKYKFVQDWFAQARDKAKGQKPTDAMKRDFYNQSLDRVMVAGIPHNFGWGGIHGACATPVHKTGLLLHVDVNNYYPSLLIAWGLVTRAATNDNYQKVYQTRKALKMQQLEAAHRGDKAEAKRLKKAQLPYKKMLNALSGAMKDKANPAYDPRNNNAMCINGQLMLLDLIEHLEVVPGFELIQSNTDGLIIKIPNDGVAFEMVDDICYEWECRCSTAACDIGLALDVVSEIYQKDVNNYLWIEEDGSTERIGGYVKPLNDLENDLPILNKALVDYMVDKVPIEKTIRDCKELIMFQKVVKLSGKYDHVAHESGKPRVVRTGVRVIKEHLVYDHTERFSYKSYRVFASTDLTDGRILKCRKGSKPAKFGNTPDHCFIWNDDVNGVEAPEKLDRSWYIDLAKKRLKQFGIEV